VNAGFPHARSLLTQFSLRLVLRRAKAGRKRSWSNKPAINLKSFRFSARLISRLPAAITKRRSRNRCRSRPISIGKSRLPCAAARSAEVTFGRSARNSVTAAAAVSPIIPTSGSLSSNCAPGLRHESASREMRPLPQTARADLPSLLANAVLFIDVRDGLCATARAGYTEKNGRDLMRRNRRLDHRRPRPRRAKICDRRGDCSAGKRTSLRCG
jgi:hypothetical protein